MEKLKLKQIIRESIKKLQNKNSIKLNEADECECKGDGGGHGGASGDGCCDSDDCAPSSSTGPGSGLYVCKKNCCWKWWKHPDKDHEDGKSILIPSWDKGKEELNYYKQKNIK